MLRDQSRYRLGMLQALHALMVDRDGVLVEEEAYPTTADQLRLLPGVAQAVVEAARSGVGVHVCTNQSVVARGGLELQALTALHAHVDGLLQAAGAPALSGWYVCPHHPGPLAGPANPWVQPCTCRKPQPGLLLRCMREHGLTPARCVMVGDRTTDVHAALAAGVTPVGVLTGNACADGTLWLPPEVPLFPSLLPLVNALLAGVGWWHAWLQHNDTPPVFLVGGPSRSGKTAASVCLKLALAARGVVAAHLSLDRWIVPAPRRREGMTVAQRVGLPDAVVQLRALLAGQAIDTPAYDPFTRLDAGLQTLPAPSAGTVWVVDGVLAHTLEVGRCVRVAMTDAAEPLAARQQAFYIWKGMPASQAAQTVAGRADERAALQGVDPPRLCLRWDETGALTQVQP